MKQAIRLLSFMLCIVMLLCAVPQSILAQIGDALGNFTEESVSNVVTTDEVIPTFDEIWMNSEITEAYVIGEVIENRTETAKTFRMSDGTFVAAEYGKNVHFSDENGNWEDYDNTLSISAMDISDTEDFEGYETKKSNVSIKLANNSNSSNLLKIKNGDYKLSLKLVGANKSKALELYKTEEKSDSNDINEVSKLNKFSSGAIYKDILPSIDLEYIISGSNVKENIIVKEKCDSYTITFELKLKGLVPELLSDGSIALNDETTTDTVMTIPAGYMCDAKGEVSTAVTYSIENKNGKKYIFTVTADANWINSDERAFPVIIDPSVEAFTSVVTTIDNYISEYTPTVANSDTLQQMVVGFNNQDTTAEWHSLIKSETLPALPKSSAIVNAKLRVFQLVPGNTPDSVYIAAKQITGSWQSSNVTWNTKPTYNTNALDYVQLSGSTQGKYLTFDITSAAQSWYSGTENQGVALCPMSGYGTGHAYLGTSDNPDAEPSLLITYRDTKGLESQWTFSSHSAGGSGTGYVNGYNGNLVFIHNNITTKGSILPIAVNHVYNGYLSNINFTKNDADVNAPITVDYSNMKVGLGWKLSLQETLVPISINNITWYVYNDSDGTELYFYPGENENEYLSEDGYGLYVTGTQALMTMTDDYGNTKTFTSGKLTQIADAHGNKKKINFDSYGRITSVTYIPAGVADSKAITQLTFKYDSNGYLTQITNAADTTEYITYSYSNGYLNAIIHSKSCAYPFYYNSDGTLGNTRDVDTEYRIHYSYLTDDSHKRVSTVTEHVGMEQGETVSFTYKSRYFAVNASNTPNLYNISLFDNYGRAFCSYSSSALSGGSIYSASYAKFNATEKGSKLNNTVSYDASKGMVNYNYIPNASFETTTYWMPTASDSNASATLSESYSYIGTKSLALSSSSISSGVLCSTSVSLAAGTYSLSAYVKTVDINGTCASIMLDGTESRHLTGTTNTAVNNGWQRISVTKTFETSGTYTIDMILASATGTAYFDGVLLETGTNILGPVNLIQNSGFTYGDGWSNVTYTTDVTNGYCGYLSGTVNTTKRASQSIVVNAPGTTSYILSGWAKANSVYIPMEGDNAEENTSKQSRSFGIRAQLLYSDSTQEIHNVNFEHTSSEWQYASMAVVPQHPDKTVSRITVYLLYDYNCQGACFDDIALTVEPSQSYTYDENGNLTYATDALGNQSAITYAENGVDLSGVTTPNGAAYDYTYNSAHKITKAVKTADSVSQTLEYDYDTYGNATSVSLTASDDDEIIISTAAYGNYGNYLTKVVDSIGGITNYNYDYLKGLLNYIEDANSNRTRYIYDERNRVQTVYLDANEDAVQTSSESAVTYLYSQNRLSSITTNTTEYTILYDSFGNISSIDAGDIAIANYTYAANNGNLLSVAYGNGDSETYEYDFLDRLVKVYYNGSEEASYSVTYDANGQIRSIYDSICTHVYDYDTLGRLVRAWQYDSSGNLTMAVENSFDSLGRANGTDYVIGSDTYSYDITYDTDTDLPNVVTLPTNAQLCYSYDSFDRVSRKVINAITSAAVDISYGYKANTSLISTNVIRYGSAVSSYQYTYDSMGNILTAMRGGFPDITCEYDEHNQLICVANKTEGYTYLYEYDNAGNITKKYKFDYTTAGSSSLDTANAIETITYGYESSLWGDLLTNINGTEITYDASGNPTKWHNSLMLSWSNQRLSKFYFFNGRPYNYTYNSDGIRTGKSNAILNTHKYILDGTKILRETVTGIDNYVFNYFYDESGNVLGFKYNNVTYTYLKNIQGDVIGIIDNTGARIVSYTYDVWGKILSITGDSAGTIGQYNPFRYRSYYYDNESGFYYLNSRYYDPTVGRFLSPDSIEYLGSSNSIYSYNLYAYCCNNPMMYCDPKGNWPTFLEEIGSRFMHTFDIVTDIIASPFKATSIEVGGGVGVGASAEVDINGVPVEAAAVASITDSFVYENGQIDVKNTTSSRVEATLIDILGFSHVSGYEHSYFDDNCTCNFWDSSFGHKSLCPANIEINDNQSTLGFSFSAYCLVGVEASISIDIETWNEELNRIFEKSRRYKSLWE